MSRGSSQVRTEIEVVDDIYVRLLQAEQDHTRTRWTVTTFFMSVSFAILGLSFQNNLAANAPFILRISGLLIYWFAFLLFLRFQTYDRILRDYMEGMEAKGRTTLDIQRMDKDAKGVMHHLTSRWLLLGFGLLYVIGVLLLQVFRW